jgi:hypothetical protein
MRTGPFPALLALAVAAGWATGCGDAARAPVEDGAASDPGRADAGAAPPPAAQPDRVAVLVHFSAGEEVAAVERRVTGPAVLHAALEAQLRGPTAEERAQGLHSFFSEATAGRLRSVALEAGRARVDFENLAGIIPNASTSAGSRQLLAELNATVFQFPGVEEVEYRFDGSCEAFWNFLQGSCTVARRGELVR